MFFNLTTCEYQIIMHQNYISVVFLANTEDAGLGGAVTPALDVNIDYPS